jgi:hypothetical protein
MSSVYADIAFGVLEQLSANAVQDWLLRKAADGRPLDRFE